MHNQPPSNSHRSPVTAVINLLLTLGYMSAIYWLSSIPGETDPENPLLSGIILWTPPAVQNLAHIPLFGILALLWYRSLSAWMRESRLLSGAAFLLASGFGILDEWHQLHVPGRYASFTDIALNILGAAFAIWLLSRAAQKNFQASI
jgi:VanZ family protein